MADQRANLILSHLGKLAARHAPDQSADVELLERFAGQRDEAAFAALVARHGPMVLRVCRRVLPDWQAAEDAFQATFLILARKAGALSRRECLAGWLHGVAYRVAARARVEAAKRLNRESRVEPRTASDPLEELSARELCAVLDEELTRLPSRYRLPLLLCYLEGQTRDQVAQQLGWSLRTLTRRLARGRELLRARLTRRGITLASAVLMVDLALQASAGVPSLLVANAVKGGMLSVSQAAASGLSPPVAAPAEGVLQTMSFSNLKTIGILLVALTLAGGGVGVLAYGFRGQAVRTLLDLLKNSASPAVRLGAARSVLELGLKVREVADLEERLAALEQRMGSDAA
jgi:RNA polymerase sigma factor (sigma-70 family)